ncbi:hypothetical protein [Thioalkalivibrio thiocyanodenitrificans]|uniref:hypothetical protein n=1 Tax=Thioalkalivibrio thiocyanodenitrificans TaxID=243063 RepID=UPI00036ADB8A|nr:hypothetical protein [Thioalkalivibrio thiocyanodenitrificans]
MKQLPIRYIAGHMPGLSVKDGTAFVHAYIERNIDAIDATGYWVQKYEDGILYEIQEGGKGRALLPSILKKLQTEDAVIIPTSTRQVRLGFTERGFQCLLLPESSVEEETPGIKGGPKLKPAKGDAKGWVISGGVLVTLGLIVAISGSLINRVTTLAQDYSLGMHLQTDIVEYLQILYPRATAPAFATSTPAEDLPIAQWDRILREQAANEAERSYVTALRYNSQTKQWQVDLEAVDSDDPGANDLSRLPPRPSAARRRN